ncbi:MAG: FAD:protein FMN transferase [Flavobacteriaceae bacterium]
MTKTLALVLLLVVSLGSNAQTRFEYRHRQMGTQIRLVFYTSDHIRADSASKAVFSRIDELNAELSDYLVDSELNMLCLQAGKDVSVSSDLYLILKASVAVSEQTKGAFDVTTGPLIRLWRRVRKTKIKPSTSQIKKAMQKVGHHYIVFPDTNTIRLEKKGMQLDLGGIGKGFAADEVLKVFELYGIRSALVDMGGDIRVSDPPPNKKHWVLAFSYYNADRKEIVQKIKLKNQAVATSGDLYQYLEIDGIRYSHIIDPQTGMALGNGIQVTTIATNATLADAYASAFSVIGIEEAINSVQEIPSLEFFMVENYKQEHKSWQSKGFMNHLVE